MANKDGIVSIGFDYKKELDEVCATIEKELNNLGGDINLSDGIKKQMAEVKKMITDMKKDIGSSFDKITETKLDTKTFESFKKDVNKRIREINKEVTTLKEQFSTLDGSANVNGIVQQFANLKKHVEDSNASISEFINNSEKLGKSVIISPNLDTDSFKNEIAEIKSLLTKLGKEDFDFGYSNKSAKELGEIARELVFDYRDLSEEIEETKSKLNSMNNSDKGFKEQEAHLSKISLELIECGRKIDDVFGSENSQKVDWEKYLNINEIDEISKYVAKKTEEIRANAQQIINSIATSNNISSTNKNNGLDNTNRSNNIEVHISTKQSTINKQLDEMIDNLQQRAANKPIIAPVKLRVDSEYEKTTKDTSASALTENQINEARKDVESVVPGLEKAFNNSMRIATNKAVENAKESIKAVREFFESNPITVHLTIPEDERLKIGKSILSEDGKTVDISGQVDKARKSVKGLSEDLEKSQLLIKENAQNAKNLSLEKLVNSLSETMAQFSELKGIISSIQNMENTIARASGISSTNELVQQWSVVEKTIINATKLDGDFRKNANMGKIVSEYQKYIDMGGTNALSSINKIKDNEATINSILSKMKELKSQDIENSSIQKLSIDLDGVIAKFDELISTVKTATNALYKIIKQGSVSDLDKQWSSISNKFKSIADESGKINLSKQKTDIKELMDMYQKYENAGGANSLISLTDNVETLRKLDKEYQKLNQTQSVDNSSTIKKESESFKNVEKSVDSLTTAIGDTKVQAINVEATAMEDAAEREIMAIRSILDNLDLVVSRLKDIKGIKLPKIEVKNVDVVEKAVESLENTGNKSNISSENSIADSKKELSNIIDISSKFNKSLDTTDKKYEKIKNDILTVVDLYKKMLSVNDDFDKYNEAYSKTYDYVKKIGLEQNVYWNKIWQGVKTGVENDNYDDLINGIYSGSIRENNSITEFNKEVIKLDKILQALYGKSINYKEVFLDIFNKLRDGAYSYDKALNKIQEDMNNKPSDLFNDMLYNEGLYPSQLKDNKPSLTIVEGQNKIQEELDETVAKINNVGKAYDIMAYRGIEAEEAVAKASKNYNGATHWSSDEKIARGYGDIVTSGNISLKNAFEVDGNGAYWDKIQILGDGLEENSKKAIEFSTSIDKVYSELSTLLTLNSDFNKFNPGFALYSSIGEEISKLSEEQKSQDDSESKITSEKIQRLAKIRDLYADLVAEYDKFSRDTSHPYGLKTTDELTKYAQANGYDGAIYKNIIDAKHSPIISGNEYIETSNIIVSFYENQVEYLEKISRKGQEYIRENISNLNIDSPIEDVFQGNDASKINEVAEATNNLADAENRLNIVEDKKSAQKYWQGRFKDSISDMTKTNDELVKMNKYYSDLEKLNEKITSAQNKVNNANIEVKKLEKRNVQSDDYVKAVDNYKNAITELQKYINNLNDNGIQSQDDIDELNRLQKAVDEVSKSINNMTSSEKGTSIAKSSTVFLKIEDLRNKYKGMSKDMLNELDKLERKFREAGNSLDAGKAIGELKQFEAQLIKTGTATNSLWSAMKNKAFYNFANQLGTMFSFYDLINVGREIVTNIKEVDAALTELRKVSDATEQRLTTNFKNSADTAKELGATISDVISATADWSRMGYNIDQAEELARVSTLYKNVGDGIDIETANNSLISTLQGFQLDASEAESIIDKFNEVANNYAIDSAGIGEALQRSAASFNAANTDLSKSIALITATNEVVQDPDSVGTLWKTMSARIRGKIVPIYNENYSLCA